jgi:hypothetical protein
MMKGGIAALYRQHPPFAFLPFAALLQNYYTLFTIILHISVFYISILFNK